MLSGSDMDAFLAYIDTRKATVAADHSVRQAFIQ
jgi:hypothetical protein